MNAKSRIASILRAESLDFSITGFKTFHLSGINLESPVKFPLPANVRLGHLAEKIVSRLIKASSNFELIDENIQIIEERRTVGELDFILREIDTNQFIHLELAYKFYLFDPNISDEPIKNWIGPNRNDSLKEKLEKLKRKQFPLLYHPHVKTRLHEIELDQVSQALCLLASLYIPYEYEEVLSPAYAKAVKGYYLNWKTFAGLDYPSRTYHIPLKKEWGMDPSDNKIWAEFKDVEEALVKSLSEKQARLCWQKDGDSYSEFFIVWW
ncbi:DUF1853 family protein [Cryomorphaceae bacterium 1068]|nr:DUF1853 family protein [Cryomorphaceae bacterium 1068]